MLTRHSFYLLEMSASSAPYDLATLSNRCVTEAAAKLVRTKLPGLQLDHQLLRMQK